MLVPIHCSRCPECKVFEFSINHKPKKIKEVPTGKLVMSELEVHDSEGLFLTLRKNKFYGLQDHPRTEPE